MPNPSKPDASQEFERFADQPQRGVASEFLDLLLNNKKWWLTPIVVTLLFVGMLVMLGGSVAGPFIYTLF